MLFPFSVGRLFDILTPEKRFNANAVKFGGKYRYVSRGESNNGVKGYITEDVKYLNPAGTISFGQDTATMFFQKETYFTGDKIKVFRLKDRELTRELSLYLIAAMKKAFSDFAWGSTSFSVGALKAVDIVLPAVNRDEPDYDYMEEFIKTCELEYIQKLEQQYASTIKAYKMVTGLTDSTLTDAEKDMIAEGCRGARIESFQLSDLFEIAGTKSLDAGTLKFQETGINFVGRTNQNNGVQGKIPKQFFAPNDAGTLTASVIGNYKYVTYQRSPYYASQNINKLTPKTCISELAVLFLMAHIQKFLSQYEGQQGGYTLEELKQHRVRLPALSKTEPDYGYMECFIRAQQKLVINIIIERWERKISAYKLVIT